MTVMFYCCDCYVLLHRIGSAQSLILARYVIYYPDVLAAVAAAPVHRQESP